MTGAKHYLSELKEAERERIAQARALDEIIITLASLNEPNQRALVSLLRGHDPAPAPLAVEPEVELDREIVESDNSAISSSELVEHSNGAVPTPPAVVPQTPRERAQIEQRSRPLPPRKPKPEGPATRGTIELAIKKVAEGLEGVRNSDVLMRFGLTDSGADQRIQAAYQTNGLIRVGHGVYAAHPAEYRKRGLPVPQKLQQYDGQADDKK